MASDGGYAQMAAEVPVLIVFDRPQPVYTAGEVVSGRVVLNLNNTAAGSAQRVSMASGDALGGM